MEGRPFNYLKASDCGTKGSLSGNLALADSCVLGSRREGPFALWDLRAFWTWGYGNEVEASRRGIRGPCDSHSTQESGVKARLPLFDCSL